MATSDELLTRLRALHPKIIDLSLDRVRRLLERLGSPHLKIPPVIHVAGTNGKGSVCAYLKAMLEAGGKRVHVFTSPHLVRFHERIALPGADGISRPIDDQRLVDVLSRAEAANAGEPMTFFEITTAAAFLAFAETPADALILEVGLGGRLDATNVVEKPLLTLITSISMDHTQYLGDTIEKIAAEKAGILKRGVPCVVAKQEDAVLDVIRSAAHKARASLVIAGEDYLAFEQHGRLVVQEDEALFDLPLPALLGRHQIGNAGQAVVAAHRLKPALALPEEAIERGLLSVRWPARMQRLSSPRLLALLAPGSELWLDGGHNPGGGEAIAATMADLEERVARPLYLVSGMMKQKDAVGYYRPFRGLARAVVTVPIPQEPNAAAADALALEVRSAGLEAEPASGIEAALGRVTSLSGGAPVRVLVCGSLYLAGHVLALQDGVRPQMN